MGKNRGLNKRGINLFSDQLIFVIIVLAFCVVMITFVARFANQASLKEQIYSKQIALAIDKARPGTYITMDISDIFSVAKKNRYDGKFITIDNINKKILIQLTSSKGYTYGYFNDNWVSWNINDTKKGEEKLTIFVSQ
jgi:hypothetical protein